LREREREPTGKKKKRKELEDKQEHLSHAKTIA
jgi:hypothetical protein